MKNLLIFLLFLSVNSLFGQAKINCFDKKIQDSLENRYINNSAHLHSYNSQAWQDCLDSLIRICPNIAEAYREKAIPYIKGGDWGKAMPLEDKAVSLDPENVMDYRAFLKAIFTKDYEGAIADFDAAEKLHPQNFVMDHSYHFFRGICHLAMGNLDKAETFLLKDIAVQSSSKPHFNSLWYCGVLYLEMKNYEKAERYLIDCVAQYESHPDANYYLAMTYLALNNKDLAKKYLLMAQNGLKNGYTHNEDNRFYANYPYEITIFEIEEALKTL
jgi:tetratricopeptide (TPR) repeat protein